MRWLLLFLALIFSTPAYADLVNVRAGIIQYQPSSTNSPSGEQSPKAFDGSPNSKYLNFDKWNMGVGIKLSTGRPVSAIGFVTANDSPGRDPMTFSLYGSNDGITWVSLAEHLPTQVSSNRYTQSPITSLANTSAYAYYYIRFPTMRYDGENSIQIAEIQLLYESTSPETSTATGSLGSYPALTSPPASTPPATVTTSQQQKINQTSGITGNSVYLQVSGSNNSVTIEQFSRNNAILGPNGTQYAVIQGMYNNITMYQGSASTILGQNLVELSVIGDSNVIGLTQEHNSKYAEIKVSGSGNSISAQQRDVGGKSLFVNAGSSSILNLTQQGSGNHFLDVSAPFSGGNITVNQSGGNQKLFSLTINSPNVGVTVSQTNSTAGDSAAMTITCTTGPCNGYSYTKN